MKTNEFEYRHPTATATPGEENDILTDEERELAEEDDLDLREIRTSDDVNEPDAEDEDLDILGVDLEQEDEDRDND